MVMSTTLTMMASPSYEASVEFKEVDGVAIPMAAGQLTHQGGQGDWDSPEAVYDLSAHPALRDLMWADPGVAFGIISDPSSLDLLLPEYSTFLEENNRDDHDNDGINDLNDLDDDNDGIIDPLDIDPDCDLDNDADLHAINGALYRDDGPNNVDSDVDGDGLENDVDWDDDNDGIADRYDPDDGNCGIVDSDNSDAFATPFYPIQDQASLDGSQDSQSYTDNTSDWWGMVYGHNPFSDMVINTTDMTQQQTLLLQEKFQNSIGICMLAGLLIKVATTGI